MIFLQECGDFTWRMTDYEELVGVNHSDKIGNTLASLNAQAHQKL